MLTPASVASVLVTTFAAVVVVADEVAVTFGVVVVGAGVETGDEVELFSDGAS